MSTKEIRVIDGVKREVVIEHLPTVIPKRDAEYCAQTIGGGVVSTIVSIHEDRTYWVSKAPKLPFTGGVKYPEEL